MRAEDVRVGIRVRAYNGLAATVGKRRVLGGWDLHGLVATLGPPYDADYVGCMSEPECWEPIDPTPSAPWVPAVGSWVNINGCVTGRVVCHAHAEALVEVDAGKHGMFFWPASALTPWVPRVGEWVRFVDDPSRVSAAVGKHPRRVVSFDGFLAHGQDFDAFPDHLEPCDPPAEVPVAIPPSPHMEAQVRELAAHIGPTCAHCGGSTYAGLLGPDHRCPVVELEPDALELVSWGHVARHYPETGVRIPLVGDGEDERPDSCGEMVWCATGRGVTRAHPTIEGAATARREAVSRGR